MDNSETGQVSGSAAEIYEEFFLPALFQEWAGRVADAAKLQPGHRVLDVACGTGVLAREVAERVGKTGAVVGLDPNEGMLAVAKRKAPEISWQQGRAEAIPFDSESFDSVVSQFGLMFFEDQLSAIREMFRVLRPGGNLTVAVWDLLENSPGYLAMTELLERLFGGHVSNALRAPFNLGDTDRLSSLFRDAGLPKIEIKTVDGTARFPSIRSWVHTDVRGWTLADMIDDAQYELLVEESEKTLHRFVTADGTVAFGAPAHIVTASKH
ncbi:MAG: class I SAM-dependent methyltransferase [Blastocatellia bacterium]